MAASNSTADQDDGTEQAVVVTISCRDLKPKDTNGKLDLLAEVYLKAKKEKWKGVGHTEVVNDAASPVFKNEIDFSDPGACCVPCVRTL